ncbi:Protein of unknown function [Cotesia congregata]|uniref:Uncharacterized protein n=1 Tax=Cotesia congregata TaxID=51543 RepID=A0A8J2HEV4_COTCN|nr:Protein of unknown function [Cotesia congregata]
MMELMGITIGTEAHSFAIRRNEIRIERSELRASAASKEGRTARLAERTSQNIEYEVEEGPISLQELESCQPGCTFEKCLKFTLLDQNTPLRQYSKLNVRSFTGRSKYLTY